MDQTEALTSGLRSTGTQLLYKEFCLRVVQGPDAGAWVLSSGEETTIGTGQGTSLTLSDRAVSRHHAAIRATEHGLELRDLDSKNGTIVGGHRIAVAFVQPGSLISCGRDVLRVELTGQEVGEQLSPRDHFGGAIGVSPAMRRVFAMLERFAPTDSTVLLEGETGTGKDVLAQAIHDASRRAGGPFVVVDLGAISPTLIESELFGHVRGAFTGAIEARRGEFEAANGGTVFLDEVGEMPLALQPVLLRALESRSIKRVGENRPLPIDVRVIAATNRDLRSEVNHNRFRADLYYRLAVLRVEVPPLRRRREDIPLLVQRFHQQLSSRGNASGPSPLSNELITALSTRTWPGNVRELRSAVERALIIGAAVEPVGDVAPAVGTAIDLQYSFGEAKERAIAAWESEYLRQLLASAGGNLARAARAARMSRSYLSRLVAQHRLRR
ncbi:MAG: sigma 54-interacting transcriptional regulator [Myxococcota bacterium]